MSKMLKIKKENNNLFNIFYNYNETSNDVLYNFETQVEYDILFNYLVIVYKHVSEKKELNKIKITCSDCQLLSEYLDMNEGLAYNECIDMILCLKRQLEYLKKNNYCFLNVNPDDVIIINKKNYIMLNSAKLYKIYNKTNNKTTLLENGIFEKETKIQITTYDDLKNNMFSTPEILKMDVLPYMLDIEAVYYNVGLLILFSLYGHTYVDNVVWRSKLNGTKLYWFLIRCFDNIKNREFLFI